MAKAKDNTLIVWVLPLLILSNVIVYISADVYAAVTELEELVYLEQRLINASRNFIKEERKKLAGLKQFAQAVEIASELSSGNPEEYIANPINSYLLLKRFTWGWKELGSLLNLSEEKLKDIDTILRLNNESLPTYEEDFVGAAAGLFRLQETYAISAYDMAEGTIRGTKPSLHKLTAADCYELGVLAYRNDKYVRMLEWLEQAERLRMLNITEGKTERLGNLSSVLLFEHLSWAYYISSNYEKALQFTELALKYNSTDATMQNNAKYYNSIIRMKKSGGRVPSSSHQFDFKQDVLYNAQFYNSTYARSCRGIFNDNHTRPLNYANVRCFYKRDNPRLLLKPLKVECVHDNPELYIFYDVLREKEIDLIKHLSKPKLAMATVYDLYTGVIRKAGYRIKWGIHREGMLFGGRLRKLKQMLGLFDEVLGLEELEEATNLYWNNFEMARAFDDFGKLVTADYRVCKSSWLFYEDTPLYLQSQLRDIDRRCSDVSGLSIRTAEELQVVNYGIGGQYEFHKDYGEKGAPLDVHEDGNRIATLLFYLSDVEAGGETVFTKAGVTLKPKKFYVDDLISAIHRVAAGGDAAFWFNLHRNTTGDWRTEHASCPVISGSKWVMNKWFHTKGNDQARPCTLKQFE